MERLIFLKFLARVLQRDTLAPYLFVIVLAFVLRMAIEGANSKLNKIWKSSLIAKIVQAPFIAATVESVLLYGCEAWTITSKLAKNLDGCYTYMLRSVFNIPWKQHI